MHMRERRAVQMFRGSGTRRRQNAHASGRDGRIRMGASRADAAAALRELTPDATPRAHAASSSAWRLRLPSIETWLSAHLW